MTRLLRSLTGSAAISGFFETVRIGIVCYAMMTICAEPSTIPEPYQGTPSAGYIQAVGIPKQSEKLITFRDRGRVYTVGMETGQIRYVDAKTPNQP